MTLLFHHLTMSLLSYSWGKTPANSAINRLMNLICCKCLYLEGSIVRSSREQRTGFEEKGMYGDFIFCFKEMNNACFENKVF